MSGSTESGAAHRTDTAVSLRGVGKTYQTAQPVRALHDVSFELPRGSYTAVMGPSGSGKSTLMNLIGCLDTPTEGTIVIDGQDVTALSDRERTRLRGEEIGFVFQTFNLMPRLTALQNVALPMVARDASRTARRERARSLLEQVGLGERLDHLPNELSGGQRQRVATARALVNDPTLLLADEPTGNVDTTTGDTIMRLFSELHAAGNTLLVVTHERRIGEHADRILHLLDGELERIEVVESPRRPTVDAGSNDRRRDGDREGE
ncbi:phosphonate-transporting ATPase [Salinarchaeum sp. Harcht-Bsk1]|uniref:ABC transporter ATP-binding protein n=1 Tax=Salinarchaeum sp. Harcht-Bsk1 TaxID=1333523 RepID=UPI0003423DD2|nr:ABC transporter ATP-binding protein [Salinarchaeum sp. Harcht-Bsk1]AGN00758.1 phosphonate-transporting ATPase [Salinarchaeum sp. Harcht-Bsk1]